MNEENTTIMPPEKQIVQDDRDARAEELESAFSYDGYQVVRKELFAHLRDPAIVIRKDRITFNTACITGLEAVVYVHVMFNNDLKRVMKMTRTLCVGAWQNRISAKAGRCPASHLRL